MKMQEATMEFVLFDTWDVVTTSGGGDTPGEASVSTIWLSQSSVDNFNGLVPLGGISLGTPETKWGYYAYSGETNTVTIFVPGYGNVSATSYTSSDHTNFLSADQQRAERTVRQGNMDDYIEVLNWLNRDRK